MLVLTRTVGETIRVGDDITITVLGVRGDHVRIGIDAPRDIAVHRDEVWAQIQQESAAAAATRDRAADAVRSLLDPSR